MSNSSPIWLGTQNLIQQVEAQSPQHQISPTGSGPGAAPTRGGQNPGGQAGRTARNSSTAGNSDAALDNNAGASPTPIASSNHLVGSQPCDCRCPKKKKPRFNLGQWMESEGNYFLSQSGRSPLFPAGIGLLSSLSLTPQEALGMDRLLGIVVTEGLFMTAHYLANASLDGLTHMRFRAYRFAPDYGVAWTLDIPLESTLSLSSERHYRANLFWDVDQRILTALDQGIWSVHVPKVGPPRRFGYTSSDARYCSSVVGDLALLIHPDSSLQAQVLRRDNALLTWSLVGFSSPTLELLNNLGDSNCLSRPWPFDPEGVNWLLLHQPSSLEPRLAHVTAAGGLIFYHVDLPESTVRIESLIEAANSGYSAYAFGSVAYPYEEETWDDPPGGGDIPNFDEITWEGEYPEPLLDPVARTVYVCPRRPGAGGSGPYFRWLDFDEGGEGAPALRLDGLGHCIYAAIEPVDYLTAGNKRQDPGEVGSLEVYAVTGHNAEHSTITRWFRNVPELVSYEESLATEGWFAVDGPVSALLIRYRDTHRLAAVHGHRTVLRKLTSGGEIALELDLSSGPFVGGATFSGGVSVPVAMTEELPFPENVFDIKVGPAGAPEPFEDAIMLVQNWRGSKDQPGVPAFRFITKSGTILSTVTELGPTDTIPPEIELQSETFVVAEEQTLFYLAHPNAELVSITWNSDEQDISDSEQYYLIDNYLVHVGFEPSPDDEVVITYRYLANPESAGNLVWNVNEVCLAVNINETYQWALVGTYSESSEGIRTDIYVLDLADPEAVTVAHHWSAVNSRALPWSRDFNRFTFTDTGVYWVGDLGSGYCWLEFIPA